MSNSETNGIDARQLIVDLFSRRPDADFDLPLLERAGRPFGISDGAFRTALARLKREGRVESLKRGRYRLGALPAGLSQRIAEWRDVTDRREPWSGSWVAAVSNPVARSDRTSWRWSLRAFSLEGMRQVDSDVFVRPDNLKGGAEGSRMRLRELGTPASVLVARLDQVEAATVRHWTGQWKIKSLDAGHERMAERLEKSMQRLAKRTDGSAAAEALLLGREAVRSILEDPLLPEEWQSGTGLAKVIRAMARYDSLGRAIWDAYLGRTSDSQAERVSARRAPAGRAGPR